MRKLTLALFAATSLMTVSAHAAPDTAPAAAAARTPLAELGKDDPYIWMEEIEGQRALDWAKAQNDRTLPVLQGDARYAGLHDAALTIVNAKDRIPGVSFVAEDDLRNERDWRERHRRFYMVPRVAVSTRPPRNLAAGDLQIREVPSSLVNFRRRQNVGNPGHQRHTGRHEFSGLRK